ncbi:unnamed protein product, partial [marine sediment metagenome]
MRDITGYEIEMGDPEDYPRLCRCWHADYPEALEIRYQEGDEGMMIEEFYENTYHIEE